MSNFHKTSIFLFSAIFLLTSSCEDEPPSLMPLPPQGMSSVSCGCTLEFSTLVGIVGACPITKCECDALNSGRCIEDPLDTLACQNEIADAVVACTIFGQAPPRPSPATISLSSLEQICSRFDSHGCTIDYEGSFCTMEELSYQANEDKCSDICTDVAIFVDSQYSRGGGEYYECDSITVKEVTAIGGRKEECSLTCPDIACEPSNLDTCTSINISSTPPCHTDYSSAEPFCRSPDEDPSELAAGGIISEMRTRRSFGRVDESRSHATIEIGDESYSTQISGSVDILGETCPSCPTSFRMSLHGNNIVIGDITIDQIHLSAGTGTTPIIQINDLGYGLIEPGVLNGTLSMRVNGDPGFLTTRSTGSLVVSVKRETKRWSISGNLAIEQDGKVSSLDLAVRGNIENQPPKVDPGNNIFKECSSPSGNPIHLEGVVSDPDGFIDLRQIAWFRGSTYPGEEGSELLEPWLSADIIAPLGYSNYSLLAQDSHLQENVSTKSVTIEDTTAPEVKDFSSSGPPCLWAPNHKYAVLRVGRDFNAFITDTCDNNPTLTITSAQSSQPENAIADGSTNSDVVVFPDRVCLRSERQGTESTGRSYFIKINAIDASGNQSQPIVEIVAVPHDQRPEYRCEPLDDIEFVDENDPICASLSSTDSAGSAQNCSSISATPSLFFIILMGLILRIASKKKMTTILLLGINMVLYLSACNPPAPPFKWKDTTGIECSPLGIDGETTVTENLECNEPPPEVDCDTNANNQTIRTPCWAIGPLPEEYHEKLGDSAFGLCVACCSDDSSIGTQFFVQECRPLVCDIEAQQPPEPMYCLNGYVYILEERSEL